MWWRGELWVLEWKNLCVCFCARNSMFCSVNTKVISYRKSLYCIVLHVCCFYLLRELEMAVRLMRGGGDLSAKDRFGPTFKMKTFIAMILNRLEAYFRKL